METTTESEGLEGTEGMVGSTTDESPQEWEHKAHGKGHQETQQARRKEESRHAKDSGTWGHKGDGPGTESETRDRRLCHSQQHRILGAEEKLAKSQGATNAHGLAFLGRVFLHLTLVLKAHC